MRGKRRAGSVYVLWAEGTRLFKIGYTAGPVDIRARTLAMMSPLRLLILGAGPGTVARERDFHAALRKYRTHGEWFRLPDEASWWLMEHLGDPEWQQHKQACAERGLRIPDFAHA